MAQAFSFGFNNDDMDEDNDDEQHLMDVEEATAGPGMAEQVDVKLVQPKRHTLQELVRLF